jgi:PAS domain S-box-containing protein
VVANEVTGKTDYDVLPGEQAQKKAEEDSLIMRSGLATVNKLECSTQEDGFEHWALVTKIPRYNDNGDIIGIMGISRDVTEWKRLGEESTRHLELLQSLMDAIPDLITFKDADQRFVLVNKAMAAWWNTRPDVMIGKTEYDFLPPEQARKAVDDDAKVFTTKIPVIDSLERMRSADGSEQWMYVIRVPRFSHNGSAIGTLSIWRNAPQTTGAQE